MLLASGFVFAKMLFCCMPDRNLSILRKSLLSLRFGFALAKMFFCFVHHKSLFMSSKLLLALLFREFCVAL
jgi:hypothetical protein